MASFRNTKEAEKYGYKKKLIKEFKVYVGWQVFEISHTQERVNEITPILRDLYKDRQITVEPYNHFEYVKA